MPIFDVDLDTREYCVFCVFLCLFIVDRVTVFGLFCVFGFMFVSTSASNCLERLVSEVTYDVSNEM